MTIPTPDLDKLAADIGHTGSAFGMRNEDWPTVQRALSELITWKKDIEVRLKALEAPKAS